MMDYLGVASKSAAVGTATLYTFDLELRFLWDSPPFLCTYGNSRLILAKPTQQPGYSWWVIIECVCWLVSYVLSDDDLSGRESMRVLCFL